MSDVNFINNGIDTLILCSKEETMKEICSKYAIKIQKNLDDLIFLYGGKNLNLELKLNQISEQNKINILVYDKHSTVINTNNVFKISKDVICPECGDICLIKFEDYKIKLYGCKNNHKKYILLNDYDNTQKIDESKIICNICKKTKNESYNNKFFICGTCDIYCCPLCSSIHSKEHKLIDYEKKNYLCIRHNEQFISYCETCKNNLCLQCELEHNNSHKIITYKSIYPNLINAKNKIKNMENVINAFNNDINKIIDILMNIKNSINKYNEINNKIFNNFEVNKRNYQTLQNINSINDTNIIIENLNSIIKENNYYFKFNKIFDLGSNIKTNNYFFNNLYNNINDKIDKLFPKFNAITKRIINKPININKELKFLYKNMTNDSFAFAALDNSFCAFNSYDNILYIVYANISKTIIFYNLLDNKIIKEIKNAHEEYITNFRHYFDSITKIDYIISISMKNCNIKLWNINSDNYLFNIYGYKKGKLDSACFLKNDRENLILLCNSFPNKKKDKSEGIIVFNFKGEVIKLIENSEEATYFIDSYYDKVSLKNYIITGNKGYLKSYDFNSNKLYNKYEDNNRNNNGNNNKDKIGHFSALILEDNKMVKLISSSFDGFARIWDFHSTQLLQKINLNSRKLFGICLWDESHLLIGCEDNSIKLLNIKDLKVIAKFESHQKPVLTIKKIRHNKYGECFLSGGYGKYGEIKLWILDKYN